MALDVDVVPQPPQQGTRITRIVVEIGDGPQQTKLFVNDEELTGLTMFEVRAEYNRHARVTYEHYLPLRNGWNGLDFARRLVTHHADGVVDVSNSRR